MFNLGDIIQITFKVGIEAYGKYTNSFIFSILIDFEANCSVEQLNVLIFD